VFGLRRPRSPVAALRRATAGLLALGALLLALRPEPPAAGSSVATASVVLAAADLGPGTVLQADDLRVARFPRALAPAGAARDPTVLAGRVLAAAVRTAEPVTDVRLVGGGLTELLPPGQVAAAVRPADLAVAGLVRPGDRVDVLAAGAAAPTGDAGPAGAVQVAEAALVLAVPTGTGSGNEPGTGPAGLLVLAVDRDTAARLAAASADATLTVTLPPP
jgi:pilus assembly protein CpaB